MSGRMSGGMHNSNVPVAQINYIAVAQYSVGAATVNSVILYTKLLWKVARLLYKVTLYNLQRNGKFASQPLSLRPVNSNIVEQCVFADMVQMRVSGSNNYRESS